MLSIPIPDLINTQQYMDFLKKSICIWIPFDITPFNINKEINIHSKIYHVPFLFVNENKVYDSAQTKYDLFITGESNERGGKLLKELKKKYRVKCSSDITENKIQYIKESKIILNLQRPFLSNIQYYEEIHEWINFHKLIISESDKSENMYENILYSNFINYTNIIDEDLSNIENLYNIIDKYLEKYNFEQFKMDKKEILQENIKELEQKIFFYISKCLYAVLKTKFIEINYTLKKNTLYCLHLLETPYRMKTLKKQDFLPDFEIFPAIKYPIGWVGCGLSYQNLIYNAKRCNLNKITIFEDDCLFKKDFNQTYKIINSFLDTCSNWDIFVGCLASLPDDTKFYNMYEYKSLIFLEVNKMHSTVFNIYNKTSYDIILDWNKTEEIDQFIKKKNLKNIITYPFEFSITNVKSTIHKSGNIYKNYLNMFEKSLKIIEKKIKIFNANRIKKSNILKITYGITKKNTIDVTSVIFNIIKRQNLLYGDNFLIHNFINDPYVNKPKKMFIYTVDKIIEIPEYLGKLKKCIYFE